MINLEDYIYFKKYFPKYRRLNMTRRLFEDYFYSEFQDPILIYEDFYYVFTPVYDENWFEVCRIPDNGHINRFIGDEKGLIHCFINLRNLNIDIKIFEQKLIEQSQYIKLLYC